MIECCRLLLLRGSFAGSTLACIGGGQLTVSIDVRRIAVDGFLIVGDSVHDLTLFEKGINLGI